jgi:hypothetical protein
MEEITTGCVLLSFRFDALTGAVVAQPSGVCRPDAALTGRSALWVGTNRLLGSFGLRPVSGQKH